MAALPAWMLGGALQPISPGGRVSAFAGCAFLLRFALLASLLLPAARAHAEPAPFLADSVVHALADELSGEAALRNLEAFSRQHRMRRSTGFRNAATHIVETLRGYGIGDARITRFPADGVRFYGTQKSRPPWDAEFAELWELRERGGS